MNRNKKNTDRSITSDKSDQTRSSISGSRWSEFSHYSENHAAAAGDFKDERGAVVVKYTEHTARTLLDDAHNLDKEELIKKIKNVVTEISNQEKYIKHQEEKQKRNKQLIDHLTSLTENERADIEYKKQECARLERERCRYEKIIQNYRKEVSSSSARYIMAQRLNDDLVKQKRTLEKRRDFLRRKEEESGIDYDRINTFTAAQQVLADEQEKKQNLMKRIQWYETEIAKIKNNDSKRNDNIGLVTQTLELAENNMREHTISKDTKNIYIDKLNQRPGLDTNDQVKGFNTSLPSITRDVCVVGKKVEVESGSVTETSVSEVGTSLPKISTNDEKMRRAIFNSEAKSNVNPSGKSKSTHTDKPIGESTIHKLNQTKYAKAADIRADDIKEYTKNIVPIPPTAPRTQNGSLRFNRKLRPKQ